MRILFHHRIASRDGQAVHIEELIAALHRQGHETMLVGPASFQNTAFGGINPLVDRLKQAIPPALYELLEIAYNAKAFLRLHKAVRTYRPDFVYERYSLFLLAGIWVHRLLGVPILLEVNSPLLEERVKNEGLRLHWLGRWAQRLIWNSVDYLLPVTHVLARSVAGYGVPASRITVIPNGINPERFSATPDAAAAKAALGLPPRIVLGFTGFVRGWNAVHRLIAFVDAHRELDLHILVVGDGSARSSLEERARDLGISDRLTITGTIERDDVARHVAAFDVAVLPGVTLYSSPLKLFEYLQLGRAIVGPDSENIREILTHEKNALLFDPEREESMDAALLRLCKDADLRIRLAQAARETIAEQQLTWERNAERVTAIGEALVQQYRQSRSSRHLQLAAQSNIGHSPK